MKKQRNVFIFVLLFTFFIVAFFYRFYGLTVNNPPFWVDEFASANQAKFFLEHGLGAFSLPDTYIEHYNITTHILMALSYKLFGVNEFAARFPSVLIGSLIPVVVFIISQQLFKFGTAISATLLTIFSYFQIVWSRQARGYIILQFIILASLYLYIRLLGKKDRLTFILFLLMLFFGIITHPFYYVFLVAIISHSLLMNAKNISKIIRNVWTYLIGIAVFLIALKIGFIQSFILLTKLGSFGTNNLWYYHSFLWREYGLIAFLALIGFAVMIAGKEKKLLVIPIYLGLHLFFVSFIFKPYVSRYLLPVFPYFLIAASFTITQLAHRVISRSNSDSRRIFAILILTLFIIGNGYKFVTKPKKYYSLNHDFREISNIDYHSIYALVKNKGAIINKKFVMIDTWYDRGRWYLGDNFENIYIFRWFREAGTVNGLSQKTNYDHNKEGEKILAGSSLRLVLETSDLMKLMKKYSAGFLLIDDISLPKDVRDFAEENLKKELYLDHYPLDDNPYSIWPVTLYSWGI